MTRADIVRIAAVLLLAVYVGSANVIFAYRHPWMTQTETFYYLGRLLTFSTVTEEEVREWERGR